MKFVIGIDGGGTKSKLHMADLTGNTILQLLGGPTNLYSKGLEGVEYELKTLLSQAMERSGLSWSDCEAICLGNAGADRAEEKLLLHNVLESCGISGKIVITNDAETALVAGSGKREGVVIISGTGSLAYGINSLGEKTRAGGWGHILGDEGSGYDIGIRAIKAAMRSYDGREHSTILLPEILKELDLERPEQLLGFVYQQAGKQDIAALTKVVNKAFQEFDSKAEEILLHAANELTAMADIVIRKLNFKGQEFTLVCAGSILQHIPYIYSHFEHQIKEMHPFANIMIPSRDAAYGAATIALLSL